MLGEIFSQQVSARLPNLHQRRLIRLRASHACDINGPLGFCGLLFKRIPHWLPPDVDSQLDLPHRSRDEAWTKPQSDTEALQQKPKIHKHQTVQRPNLSTDASQTTGLLLDIPKAIDNAEILLGKSGVILVPLLNRRSRKPAQARHRISSCPPAGVISIPAAKNTLLPCSYSRLELDISYALLPGPGHAVGGRDHSLRNLRHCLVDDAFLACHLTAYALLLWLFNTAYDGGEGGSMQNWRSRVWTSLFLLFGADVRCGSHESLTHSLFLGTASCGEASGRV